MPSFEENFNHLVSELYSDRSLTRIEGALLQSEDRPTFEELLTSGYTVHLDLQNLSSTDRMKVWAELVKNQEIKKNVFNPFKYRKNTDQFGILHEEYNISWLDWSGMLWSYCQHHWHTQAFKHPSNYNIFRASKNPELIMIRKRDALLTNSNLKPIRNENVISIQLFDNIPTINNDIHSEQSPVEYHQTAIKKITRLKAMTCSAATLVALLIWFLFQYPPSTAFFLGILAAIGIPFFTFDMALLAVVSLSSIIISIVINYIYTTITPESDINFWQTLNKVCYNVAFFVLPLMILICIPAAVLNINLLIIAAIAALFAIYHYLCLNEWYSKEDNEVTKLTDRLFPHHEPITPQDNEHTANLLGK